MITKRVFILRGSCFCEKYNTPDSSGPSYVNAIILPTKTTAVQNENALSYHRVRGLYFLAIVFVTTISV